MFAVSKTVKERLFAVAFRARKSSAFLTGVDGGIATALCIIGNFAATSKQLNYDTNRNKTRHPGTRRHA